MKRIRKNGRTPGSPRWLFAWLLAGLVLLSAGIHAAPEDVEDEAGQQGAVSEETEPATGGSEAAAEVFQPTEEISEDYAAPFPVDI